MGLWKPGTWAKALPVRADSWAEVPLQDTPGREQQPGSQGEGSSRRGLALWVPGPGLLPHSPC